MFDFNSWQNALSTVFLGTLGKTLDFLPNLVGAVLVFVLGIILGNWLKRLVVKGLQVVHFENWVKDTKFREFLTNAEVTEKGEEIVGALVKWLIVLTFFIAATNILGLTTVSSLLVAVLGYVPNILSAVIVLAIGVLLAGMVEGLVKGALASVDLRSARLMGKIASYTTVTIATLAAFSELQIASSFINILFIGFVAMLALGFGLAIGLGAKDLISVVLAEWYKDLKKQLKK